MFRNHSYGITITAVLIVTVVTILDQWSKAFAVLYLDPFYPVIVVESFFDLNLVNNRGAAFGILSNLHEPWRSTFFIVISLCAFLVMIYLYINKPEKSKLIPISLALVMGGAIGNIIDRIRFGYVVDFLHFHYRGYHWPTFNIADSCITIGVILLLIHMFFFERGQNAS